MLSLRARELKARGQDATLGETKVSQGLGAPTVF